MPERRIFAALALSGALLAGCGDSEGIKEGSRDQDAWRYRNLMQAVSKNVARRVGDTSYYEMRAGGACYAVSVVPNMELSRGDSMMGSLRMQEAHMSRHSKIQKNAKEYVVNLPFGRFFGLSNPFGYTDDMTTTNLITCPHCGHQFSLSDVQKHELEEMREKMKAEVEADMKKRAFAWAQEEVKKAKDEAEEAHKKEALELETLRKRDEEARRKELEFLKQAQEFETMKRNQALELEKAKMEERKKVEEEAKKQAEERAKFDTEKMKLESDKRIAELQKQLEMTQKAVEDANRKANQGSMQIQGEIQEDALKALLEANFPIDIISDVEKGIKGADIIEEVRNEYGQSVGIIAWESKNTKAWSEGWVEKLKEDRLRVGAGVSVIVSSVLPEGISRFGLYRDIWVTDYDSVLPLTIALRAHMIEIAKVRNSVKGKDEKMEVLYNYLISPEFKAKIENIVEAFSTMKDDLDREKRAMEKMWSAREKQLSRVIDNTARLYGDMQGLIGAQLGKVEYLELGGGEG